MDSPNAGLIELVLVFGAVLAFGFWELYRLRRDKRRSPDPRDKSESDPH
jgi:hypothetical protein